MKAKMSPKVFKFQIASVVMFIFLCNCTGNLNIIYYPLSNLKGEESLDVKSFKYKPYEIGEVEINEFQWNGYGHTYLDKPIDDFVTEAFKNHLKYIGYTIDKNSEYIISGHIQKFQFVFRMTPNQLFVAKIFFSFSKNSESNIIFSKAYEAEHTVIHGMYQNIINNVLRDCFNDCLNEIDSNKLLS